MEVSALTHAGAAGLHGRSPLLRLRSDEQLVALTRRGNHAAFEALVARYESRLLAFCRHMLGSREDAEDVLQEVFAAAFNAMLADERAINARPWLYRIARNRSLNHLRRQQAIGVDSMDVHLADNGITTADRVHGREEFRQLIGDVQELPESQRTALLLREIDALSYDQIAQAMETTVPSVKSLLVRARVSLAEAAEARAMTCEDVREELGEVAEGLARITPPVRRHVRTCERCGIFRKQLKQTNKALAAVYPVAPLLLLKKTLLAHLGTTAAAGGATTAASTAAGAVGGAAATSAAGGMVSAGMGAVASKAAAGLAAAAIVTAGAAEVGHVAKRDAATTQTASSVVAAAAPAAAVSPVVVESRPQPAVPVVEAEPTTALTGGTVAEPKPVAETVVAAVKTIPVIQPEALTGEPQPVGAQIESGTTALPGTAEPAPPAPVASEPAPAQPAPAQPAPAQPAPAEPAPSPPPSEPAPAEPAPAPSGSEPPPPSGSQPPPPPLIP